MASSHRSRHRIVVLFVAATVFVVFSGGCRAAAVLVVKEEQPEPEPCRSAAECHPDTHYCGHGKCTPKGKCHRDTDCHNPANHPYKDKRCRGYKFCNHQQDCDRHCGTLCPPSSGGAGAKHEGTVEVECTSTGCATQLTCLNSVSCTPDRCHPDCPGLYFDPMGTVIEECSSVTMTAVPPSSSSAAYSNSSSNNSSSTSTSSIHERNTNTNKNKKKNRSQGCTKKISNKIRNRVGTTWYQNQTYGGELLPVRYGLPKTYFKKKRKPKHRVKAVPLVLFFHGYGGTPEQYREPLDYFTFPPKKQKQRDGMMTVALTGMGGSTGTFSTSWKGVGSTSSSADQPTCNSNNVYCTANTDTDYYYEYGFDSDNPQCNCYEDCNSSCDDKCWWTTCKDSVQQTKKMLKHILQNYCIDTTQIWAIGSSNGGMFVHELAQDARIARYFAGIIPMAGLPHFGFNAGPASSSSSLSSAMEQISYLGLWGADDTVVPPVKTIDRSGDGLQVPCRSVEEQGWYYTTAECVTEYWGQQLQCNPQPVPLAPTFHANALRCWSYTNCATDRRSNVEITGCITNDDHYTSFDYAFQFMVDYIKQHPKLTL